MKQATHGLRILLVDDSPEDRELYRRLLEKDPGLEFEFLETESGEDAIEICRSGPPDCILLDYKLPDIDGLEFLDALADEDGSVSVPVVMLTGVGRESVAVDAIKRGAQDYLVKGEVTADSLLRAVNHAIEKIALQRKLTERKKELEQFVYVASHDLKAPLRTITGFCSIIQQKYTGELDEKADKYIGMIVDAARQMAQLIDGLLEYSRIGRSPREKKPEVIDLDHVLRTVVANLDEEIRTSEARIECDPLPVVQSDRTALTQLFMNLVSNAIKFRGDRVPHIRVSAVQTGDFWEFSVADNGIGIEPKYHQEVMMPFRRLHSISEYEGTGLGLAICRKAVKHLGGEIWVDSTAGQGSTFRFTLPASSGDSTELDRAPAPSAVGA